MIAPRLFVCSGASVDPSDPIAAGRQRTDLDSIGNKANVNIRFENVAKVFNQHLSPRLVDLLEIAAYVYAADCSTRRGTQWTDENTTEPWGRDFTFVIPVREQNFWNSTEICQMLTEVLSFLSNDKYSFTFVSLEHDRPEQQYFEFGDPEDWHFHAPERVVMFSGGLDSLAGAVESARAGDRLALVSHRPVSTLSSRQKKLFSELQKEFPDQLIHIPVWINKNERFGQEPTQRTRSFLYAALGTVVAESVQAGGVRFFENGIVSLNLPVADEALRARASRTTHPVALHLLKSLCSAVTGRDFAVDNPYLFKTKTDVVKEIHTILSGLPEPAGTAFAIAAFMGLRHGEIRGLQWENYQNEEMQVSRSIWNGRVTDPKTRKGRAPVPVIRPLAERLELHRLRCGNPQTGPIFANALGKPLALSSITNRLILPSLNICERCGKRESNHQKANHAYKRDNRIPEWHGWHAARRGLGSNLYRLGVPDMVIQRILRHANVSTTATYYIKTAADDVRNAMAKLESHIAESGQMQTDTNGTLAPSPSVGPSTI